MSLTGTTSRPITFVAVDHRTRTVTDTRTFPAGTTVYASETRKGLRIRVAGTLFTQDVALTDVTPA